MQVSTSDGRIKIIGKEGVERNMKTAARMPEATRQLKFLYNRGIIVRVDQVNGMLDQAFWCGYCLTEILWPCIHTILLQACFMVEIFTANSTHFMRNTHPHVTVHHCRLAELRFGALTTPMHMMILNPCTVCTWMMMTSPVWLP